MPYLYVLNGRHRHGVFRLGDGPDDEVILGQRDDAQGRLTDPWISWSHARLRREGGLVTIEDLGSTNGTYVNCERVTRRSLSEDDVIFLGRTHILYVATDRAPSAVPAHAGHMAQQGVIRGLEAIPGAGGAAPGRGESTQRVRVQLPGSRQELPALEASRESDLGEGATGPSPAPLAAQHLRQGQTTGRIVGPFRDAGRLDELFQGEGDDDGLALPPTAQLTPAFGGSVEDMPTVGEMSEVESLEHFLEGPQSDDHIEIDIEDLGLGPESHARRDSRGDGSDDEYAVEAGAETDPIGSRDAEIEHLRGLVAERDAEIARLRAELTKLREQYLDL